MTPPDLPTDLRARLDAKLEGLSRQDTAAWATMISKTYRDGGQFPRHRLTGRRPGLCTGADARDLRGRGGLPWRAVVSESPQLATMLKAREPTPGLPNYTLRGEMQSLEMSPKGHFDLMGAKGLSTRFSEEEVHQYLYKQGLEKLIVDAPEIDDPVPAADDTEESHTDDGEETEFEFWQVIKAKALEKLTRLHRTIRYGEFIGSKIKLPTDRTSPMELDLLGQHEDGLFILELKIDRAAERNAFSELFAYSNYIAGLFVPSGHKDITNVLVAKLQAKITRQAFLYDLLITDRNIIVYTPVFPGGSIESMQLHLHIPTDDDFRSFTNQLLSHDAMSCCVASFNDLEGWFDSKEEEGGLRDYTKEHLEGLSTYTAQLMEAEHLHGFCFIRKPWQEVPRFYRNSLFICAINPFRAAVMEDVNGISEQLDEQFRATFFEIPDAGFYGRLTAIAERAVKDCLTHDYPCELELPSWSAIVVSPVEVAITHNFGFRPTGLLREAYVSQLNSSYAREAVGRYVEDLSVLKINEINNWSRAWMFMEGCGFAAGSTDEVDKSEEG